MKNMRLSSLFLGFIFLSFSLKAMNLSEQTTYLLECRNTYCQKLQDVVQEKYKQIFTLEEMIALLHTTRAIVIGNARASQEIAFSLIAEISKEYSFDPVWIKLVEKGFTNFAITCAFWPFYDLSKDNKWLKFGDDERDGRWMKARNVANFSINRYHKAISKYIEKSPKRAAINAMKNTSYMAEDIGAIIYITGATMIIKHFTKNICNIFEKIYKSTFKNSAHFKSNSFSILEMLQALEIKRIETEHQLANFLMPCINLFDRQVSMCPVLIFAGHKDPYSIFATLPREIIQIIIIIMGTHAEHDRENNIKSRPSFFRIHFSKDKIKACNS
jgi:hypothetical protein